MSDAFGKALLDYLDGKKVEITIEREDGHKEGHNIDTYFSSYNQWPKHEKEIMKYAKTRVLDIGAGAGRHSLYLQNKGLNVYAVDFSKGATEVMQRRGIKKIYLTDAMHLDAYFNQGFFSTVLMMCNNFGILGTVEKTLKFLQKLDEITSKDAILLATIRDYTKTDNKEHLKYQEENVKRGRNKGQVRIRINYGRIEGPWFELLMLSPEELNTILESTNWKVYKVIYEKTKDKFLQGMYLAVIKKTIKT